MNPKNNSAIKITKRKIVLSTKTGFSDQERISLMNCNTKISFHHWLDMLFFSLLDDVKLVKGETSAKRH